MRSESFGQGAGEQSGITYQYLGVRETGGKTKHHEVHAIDPSSGGSVGRLVWTAKHVHDLYVDPAARRKGVATGLWNHAQSVADGRSVPAPKHSTQRTTQGDAWARSVGGRLPRLDRR